MFDNMSAIDLARAQFALGLATLACLALTLFFLVQMKQERARVSAWAWSTEARVLALESLELARQASDRERTQDAARPSIQLP